MHHISILCNLCKRQIGTGKYQKYHDEQNGMTYYWHADLINNCAEKVKQKVIAEYLTAITLAKRGRIK